MVQTPTFEFGRRRFLGLSVATAGFAAIGLSGCTAPAGGNGGEASGVLRLTTSDGSTNDTLDPLRLERTSQIIPACMIYESLVDVDEQLQTVPRLAKTFETTDDGTTWIFKLQDNVTFHDGSKLTSADVSYSIGRALTPGEGSANALAGQLTGILTADGITTPDDQTVQFKLKKPYIFFPDALATRFARIYKSGTTDFTKPVGTGPFQFDSFTPGQQFAANRYDGYWGGKPQLSRVELTNISNEATRLSSFLGGDTDLIFQTSTDTVPDIQKDSSFSILEQKAAEWAPLGIDSTVAPFNNPDLIKAIKAGIDRQEVIKVAYAGFGSLGYDTPISQDDFYFGGLTVPVFDASKAKQLLASAGYSNGITLPNLTVLDLPQNVNVALVVQQQLKKVGINFEITREPAATYWDNSWLKKPFYTNNYNRRNADEVFKLVYASDGKWNMSKISDPEVDKAINAAAATTDKAAQKEFYTTAQELVAERNTTVVIAHASRLSGVSSKVSNVATNPIYFLDLRKAGVSS